jgi:hypothetical protein
MSPLPSRIFVAVKVRTAVDPKVSALERTFQFARSGWVANVDEIRKQLRREGYDANAVGGGRSLLSQLRELIKAARLEPRASPKS